MLPRGKRAIFCTEATKTTSEEVTVKNELRSARYAAIELGATRGRVMVGDGG